MQNRNSVALVVGGTGVVGKAIVEKLLEVGCDVVVITRGRHSLDELKILPLTKSQLIFYTCDVTQENEVQTCFKEIKNQLGHIDFLVHTAGLEPDPDTPLIEYPTESWYATFNTYVTSFFFCLKEALKLLENNGHIVVISSAVTRFQGDKLPPIYVGHYAAAKAALNELCKWARKETHQRGILLSLISPGAVDCPFHRQAPLLRRPQAMVSPDLIAQKATNSILNSEELEQEIIIG